MSFFCTNCGSKMEDGQQFCTSCGMKVTRSLNAAAPADAQSNAPSQAAHPNQAAFQPNKPTKNKKVTDDNRGFRLGMSWLFSLVGFIFIISFFAALTVRKVVNISEIAEAVGKIDITEIKVSDFGDDSSFSEDTSVAEAIVLEAAESLGVEIDEEKAGELLENENFKNSLQGIYSDVIEGTAGEFSATELSEDVLNLLSDNSELIEEVTGKSFSEEEIEALSGKIEEYFGDSELYSDSSDNGESDDSDSASGESDSEEANSEDSDGQDASEDGDGSSINISGIMGLNDDISAVSEEINGVSVQISEISNGMNLNFNFLQRAMYLLLAFGLLCFGMVIFFNRHFLATGFRFDAIFLMIIGCTESLMGYMFGKTVDILNWVLNEAGADDIFDDVQQYKDIIEKVIKSITDGVSESILLYSVPMLAVGVALLIASIVIACITKKRKQQ